MPPGFLRRAVAAGIVNLAALASTGCADAILLHPTHEAWGRSPADRRVVGFEGGDPRKMWARFQEMLRNIGNPD